MKISSIMTRNPRTLALEASPDDALRLMDDEDVRHLPIMDGARLAGVISDRDLFSVLGWVPATTESDRKRHARAAPTVADLMQTQVTSVGPKDPIMNACAEFLLQRIGCVLVLKDGVLIGIVTEMDVMAAFQKACDEGSIEDEGDPPVSRLMTICSTVVEPDSTLKEASELCHDLKARHLPVVHDGALVGMLSDRDLRAAHGGGQPEDTPVERIMSTQLISLEPDDRTSLAAELMVANRISAIPIVLDDSLAGLLTTTDLIEHAAGVLAPMRERTAQRPAQRP